MSAEVLTYLSICSGIEAATVAWHHLGWQPAGYSEIDPFARTVLAHHYPDVPLHGDFTMLTEKEYGTIDLIVGGTPCQSFSIAGQRRGLADDRGNLAFEFIRLAERSRARWLVWENVPGILSIDGGRTFGAFLRALAQCGYGFAYRVLDAQYFGVPQRRRRVFVVGYSGDWRPAAAVLFERESLCRDIAPRRQARQGVAALTASGVGTCGADDNQGQAGHLIAQEISPTITGNAYGDHESREGLLVAHTLRGEGFDASEDGTGRGTPLIAGTVSSKWAKGTGGPAGDECQNLITAPVAYNITFCDANGRRKDRPDGGMYVNATDQAKTVTAGGDLSTYIAFSAKDSGADAAESAPTLRAMNHTASHSNGGGQIAVAIPLQEVGKRTGISTDDASIGVGIGQDGDAMYTLQAAARHGVAFAQNSRDEVRMLGGDGDVAGALPAQPGMKQQTFIAGCFKPGQSAASRGIGYEEGVAPSLEGSGGGNNKPAVLYPLDLRNAMRDPDKHDAVNRQGNGIGDDGDPAATISTAHMPGVISPMAVRRLTPRECERLQGFPDDYTLVPFRGKPAADGNRYKALGNSMAVPVMRWLGERICLIEDIIKVLPRDNR